MPALEFSFLQIFPREIAAIMIEKNSFSGNGRHAARSKGIIQ
jgi:hypothetical protein